MSYSFIVEYFAQLAKSYFKSEKKVLGPSNWKKSERPCKQGLSLEIK